jgi:hypothetical protein
MASVLPTLTPAQQAARAAALEARRQKSLIALHAAARQAGIDDDTRRQLLALQTGGKLGPDGLTVTGGKRSAADATVQELDRTIEAIRKQTGAAHPTRAGGRRRPTPSADRAALMAKVHALLAELGKVTGEPHSLRYADAIAKRNGWADAVDFCDGPALHRVVGALSRTLRSKSGRA